MTTPLSSPTIPFKNGTYSYKNKTFYIKPSEFAPLKFYQHEQEKTNYELNKNKKNKL